jgi:2-keto-4-pentenoate hydratase/2-oxohepta-3-ene-1,7-dioic acid hydratase in catechol pathway
MPEISTGAIGKFVALGGTFQTHLDEKDVDYRWPDLWIAPGEAVIPEQAEIHIPDQVNKTKPGAELTAVIGQDIYNVSKQTAWEAIDGFTISNDITAAGEWPGVSDTDLGMNTGVGYKILPTFHPVLTEYKLIDNDINYNDLDIEVEVDGHVSVSGTTKQLAFDIPELVAFASSIVHLHKGDVVALGDPGEPSIMIDEASRVTCSIEGHGTLINPIASN